MVMKLAAASYLERFPQNSQNDSQNTENIFSAHSAHNSPHSAGTSLLVLRIYLYISYILLVV